MQKKQLASIDEHIQGKQSIDELVKQNQGVTSMVATIRSRELSACLFLQAKSQLKANYKENDDVGEMVKGRLEGLKN